MDKNSSRLTIWLSWFLASLFYAYQYILRVLPNITMPEIMKRFNIDAEIFGQFAGVYYITYAAMHIPIGTWLDRKGPKYVIPMCILLSSLGVLPLMYSNSWIMACVGRALIGLGSSAAILGLFKVVHLGFPENWFARALGMGVTIGLLGAIYGSQPVRFLIAVYGYDFVLQYIVYSGILLSALCLLVLPSAKGVVSNEIDLLRDLKKVWEHKKIFVIAILAGLMVGPLEGFADAWGTTFLSTVYSLEQNLASLLPSLLFLGMCIGATVMSYVADKTRWYYGLIISSAFLMATVFLLLIFIKLNFIILSVLLFCVGIFCSYQILVIYKATTYVKEGVVGLTTSIVNMIIMMFGYFFHAIIGKMLHSLDSAQIVNGIWMYGADSYKTAIMIIPASLIVAGVGFAIIRYNSRSH
ncbi:MAG: MFS transporter [Rickettsiales bacterium]|nr:MFS transporter [Rickettsiales bacterium]